MGSDVADVMNYVRGIPAIGDLAARLYDSLDFLVPTQRARRVDQVWNAIADQYALRQCRDGVWVRGAAWLVTARSAREIDLANIDLKVLGDSVRLMSRPAIFQIKLPKDGHLNMSSPQVSQSERQCGAERVSARLDNVSKSPSGKV